MVFLLSSLGGEKHGAQSLPQAFLSPRVVQIQKRSRDQAQGLTQVAAGAQAACPPASAMKDRAGPHAASGQRVQQDSAAQC